MTPVPPSFLFGLIAAPLAKRVLKPVLRGVVRTSVGVAYEIRLAAAEAGRNVHGLAAEVAAEMAAAQTAAGNRSAARVPKARAGTGAGQQR